MLKPLLTRLLQHLIAQNAWAKGQLQAFGGKHVRFEVFPVSAMLTVLEDGGLSMAGEAASADATIKIAPGVAIRLAAGDKTAQTLVRISGDSELASVMAKVFSEMSWDIEEDLSKVIGDVPAYQLGKFSRSLGAGLKQQTLNVAEMLTEYWQEETPLLAKKRHIDTFIQEVDVLREDTERLQKRIEKLAGRLDEKSATPLESPSPATSNANDKAPGETLPDDH